MPLTIAQLKSMLQLPIIASPMFIVSGPELVIEQCKAGIVGSFPALNARQSDTLDEWLTRIQGELSSHQAGNPSKKVAPFAVNQIVHSSNPRLEEDMRLCVKHKVPLVITSLNSPKNIVKEVHSYGGLVFHDITNVKHAKNALAAGVDGLILVCAGAGGHAGVLNPLALVPEIRKFFQGPIALSGSITSGSGVLSALAMGADFAYIGTRFIATKEANAPDGYKNMLVDSTAKDIVYTPFFSGVPANYLRPSISGNGLDPDNLPEANKNKMNFDQGAEASKAKAWKDIWGAGQGVGNIDDIPSTAELVKRLEKEFHETKQKLAKL